MSKFKLCMSSDVHFIFVQVFACQMPKTCINFVKHIHWPTMPICIPPSNPWGGGSSGLTFFVMHRVGTSYCVSSNRAFCLGRMRLSVAVQPPPATRKPPSPALAHGPGSHSTKLPLSKCGVVGLPTASGMVFLYLCYLVYLICFCKLSLLEFSESNVTFSRRISVCFA